MSGYLPLDSSSTSGLADTESITSFDEGGGGGGGFFGGVDCASAADETSRATQTAALERARFIWYPRYPRDRLSSPQPGARSGSCNDPQHARPFPDRRQSRWRPSGRARVAPSGGSPRS